MEIPKPVLVAPATSPSSPLEGINEESEQESEQHQQEEEEESQQNGISLIPVIEGTLITENKNEQCSSKCSGIEISECDNSINPGTDMKLSCTIFKERSVPKFHSNVQVTDAQEEAMDQMIQSDDKDQNSQEVPSFPADHGQQEKNGSTSITVEAEIYNH